MGVFYLNKNKLKVDNPIVYDNNFSYKDYTKITNKYIEKDSRELNFQNRLIVCMLEKLLINTDIEVVDSSLLYYRGKRNSKNLDNSQFTGKKDNGKYYAPPDLLLVRNWNIDNKNNKVEYLAAIEIKSPNSKEKIHGKEFDEYNQHVKDEMRAHLSVNAKVILTDCFRWQFFNNKDGFVDVTPIDLVDENGQWIYCIKAPDEFSTGLIDPEDNKVIDDTEEWNQLQKKLLSFLQIK